VVEAVPLEAPEGDALRLGWPQAVQGARIGA
jgi:hypothetical protein